MNNLLSLLASGFVALVILMDIVTGQGPPTLNGYIGMQPSINYQPQPAIISRGPPVYPMPARSDYPSPPQELHMKDQKDEAYGGEYKHEKEKFHDKSKEYEKNYEKEKEKEKDKGMLSSLSSSVSKAWSNMGRR